MAYEGKIPFCPLIALIVYTCFLLVVGIGGLCVGLWLSSAGFYSDAHYYIQIWTLGPGDLSTVAAPGLLVFSGFLVIIVALFAFFAIYKHMHILLAAYFGVLLLIFLCELIAGFLIVSFQAQLFMGVKNGMKMEITLNYNHDSDIGIAWNRVQVRNKCCGVDGSMDYTFSNWWYDQNPGAQNVQDARTQVPTSCCVLEYNQDRDVRWVDSQAAVAKDYLKCNQDGEGNIYDSSYLNGYGCYARMISYVNNIYFNLLIGIGLGVGFLQIIGLVVSFIAFRATRQNKM